MKAGTERTVVVVCGDAGGARAMAPVLELLRSEARVPLRVFASRAAPPVWSARNLRRRQPGRGSANGLNR